MCDCCADEVDITKCSLCNCCWIDKILNSPLTRILTICFAVIVLCILIFTLYKVIKLVSKCRYRSFLKEHLNIEIRNEEFEKIIEELKKETSEKIKPHVSKETTGSYKINIDEVKKILDEAENKLQKELKSKTDLHKLYLSKLSDSFGD